LQRALFNDGGQRFPIRLPKCLRLAVNFVQRRFADTARGRVDDAQQRDGIIRIRRQL